MRYSNDRSFRRQFEFLRRQFLQEGDLPFADVLSRDTAPQALDPQALDTIEGAWNERIYTPLVSLWIFLGQVISADHSCRAAVIRRVINRRIRSRTSKNLALVSR